MWRVNVLRACKQNPPHCTWRPSAGVIVYWIVGLNPAAAAFFKFVALLVLEALAAQAMGTAVSAAFTHEKAAMAFAPAVTTVLMLFGERMGSCLGVCSSNNMWPARAHPRPHTYRALHKHEPHSPPPTSAGGFYVNSTTIPAALRWIQYISHLYYVFMGLTLNNFQ